MNHRSLALTVFTLGCLLSTARVVIDAPRPAAWKDLATQIPSRSDQRFAALKAVLPRHGIVGYIGQSGSLSSTTGAYYLTQYALAPLVVDHSPHHALVVGNFPASPPDATELHDLKLLKDFGNGVWLLAGQDIE